MAYFLQLSCKWASNVVSDHWHYTDIDKVWLTCRIAKALNTHTHTSSSRGLTKHGRKNTKQWRCKNEPEWSRKKIPEEFLEIQFLRCDHTTRNVLVFPKPFLLTKSWWNPFNSTQADASSKSVCLIASNQLMRQNSFPFLDMDFFRVAKCWVGKSAKYHGAKNRREKCRREEKTYSLHLLS